MIVLRNKEFSGEDYIKRKAKEDLKKAIEEADILEEITEKGEKVFRKKEGFLKRNKKALAVAGVGTATLATLAAVKKKKNKE